MSIFVSKLFVEGYILSDKTLGYDMEKFYDRKSPVFITGPSGAGKSTFGKMLSERYNRALVNLDWAQDKAWDIFKEKTGITGETDYHLTKEEQTFYNKIYIETLDSWIMNAKDAVVEGIEVSLSPFQNPNLPISKKIFSSSVIILGDSELISSIRAAKRDKDRKWAGPFYIIDRLKLNWGMIHETLVHLRKVMSSKAKTIEEIHR